MAVDVKLPDLGEGIESGDVLQVLVHEGDVVQKEQGIVELETDKATVEVPSTHAGRISKIHVKVGQTIAPGAALITVDTTEAPAATTKPRPQAAATQSEKTAAEPPQQPSPQKPQLAQPPAAKPATFEKPAPPAPVSKPAQQPAEDGAPRPIVAAGPAVRRFAREVGVDLHHVQGSGGAGRITRDDVLAVVRQAGAKTAAAPAAKTTQPAGPGEPGTDAWGPVRIEKMSRIRKTIAAKMHASWTAAPRVTNFDDADVTELERIRQQSKADYAAEGIKLTALPFVIKAAAHALEDNPLLNASVDLENGQIIYKDYINIGIAVDTERGLVVPALRGADKLAISEIARRLTQLADSVRNNDFSVEDLQGGTFTISNLGSVGGTYSTPIINTPEVAILLLGRSRKMPVVVDDQVQIRLMMPLSLSYDHRLVDGAAAGRFLNDLIGLLQSPGRLLMSP